MRALELSRSLKDDRGAALTTYTLGVMFDHQGRYGAALNSKQTALSTLQGKEKTPEIAEMLGGYGESLVLTGRAEEAKSYFNESLNLARELKNDGIVSQTLILQGDEAYYAGDYKSARSYYEQALQAANRSKEPERVLLAKVALGKLTARDGASQQAIASLRPLIQQAAELGLQNVSLGCSLAVAEAMLRAHDNKQAKQTIESAMVRTDKMGLKPLSARGYYLLGNIARAAGDQVEAQRQYRSALQLLDAMRQDKGAEKLLERKDLKTMYDEATLGAQAGKG
jgi:tetratricopeptide (TPR) repeat protein